jgi:hypothetical protein
VAKSFRGDLVEMRERLKERKPFAFSRFGEGELRILTGELRRYPEFCFNPSDPAYVFLRERLLDSFRYRNESYYVGISCPRCVGEERFFWAKRTSGQTESQLTWATLFVNSNYQFFKDEVVPLFSGYTVFLVCHKSAKLEGLTFRVAGDYRVEKNAWRTDYNLSHRLAEFTARKQITGALLLLCAGPFANILAHQLHAREPKNTYIDVGSALDPYMFGEEGLTRRYLKGESKFLMRTCTWR